MSILDKINQNKVQEPISDRPKVMTTRAAEQANQANKNANKVPEFLYSCPHSPTFSMHLTAGTVRAVDGLMKVTEAQHREIQELISSGRPDIAQNCVYLDTEAAEKMALEYLAKQNKPIASRGAASSQNSAEKTNIGPYREIKPEAPEGMSAPGAASLAAHNIHRRNIVADEEDATHGEDANIAAGLPVEEGSAKP